jgi:hypothetical protein
MTRKGCARRSLPLRMPWWGSSLLAMVLYCGLKYGVPHLHLSNPLLQQLAQAAPFFAPILAIPLLLLAGKQLYDKDVPKDKAGMDDNHQDPPAE